MRKVISVLSLLLVISSYITVAQSLEMEWGAEFDLDRDYRYHKIVGQDADKFYLIRKEKTKDVTKSEVWLESVSKISSGIESSYKVVFPEIQGKKSKFENLFYINEKLILFLGVHDQMKQLSYLYATEIDEDGISKETPKMIGHTSLILNPEEGFKYSLTPDQKHVLVHYHVPFNLYTGEPLYFKMIDSNLEVVESKRFELPLLKRKLQIKNYQRGESGNYYFAIQMEPAQQGRSRGRGGAAKINYIYTVMVYNAKKDSLQDYRIKVDKYKPSGIMMALNDNEEIAVFGYGTKRSSAAPSGVYYQKINPRTEKITAKRFLEFSKDRAFLAEFKQERNGINDAQWYNFTPGQIVEMDEGGFVYLTEQYYVEREVIRDPRTKQETVAHFYHYNDILAISVDDEDRMNWYRRIAKNQYSTNDKGYYSSFIAVPVMSKLKVMYNDHPKNLKIKSSEKTKELKNNVMTGPSGQAIVATVYSDGNVDKAPMFEGSDGKYSICPKLFLYNDPEHSIYVQKGYKFKWGKFFFE